MLEFRIRKLFIFVTVLQCHCKMSKKYKLLDRFLIQPIKKDLTFNELKTLLTSLGYQKIQGSRSRVKFYH
ncbi:hypothetical protein BSPWISOX_786 [uncultured Gammaproteobacteria bacterium]|nr:hypothetical protein BSPCLSOX_1951 [uncultured Gammaproteobacteria bacterium]VVH63426.1 hypothetical protein BSPWISOX_786 [uncultured Gammaproteobacteria bacterium]VVM25330.1 hypothetical protein BSPWISOXPB_5250 [uncultured Gammaproteobacteria bacterium]